MAILPATIFNQNSNPLDAIFSQATNGLQSSLNAAIQRGQQIASTQLQQENAFLQERERQQQLEERKAKNIRDIFNDERTLANKNTNDQYQIIENNRINNRADRTLNLQQQDAARLSEYINQVNGIGGQAQTTGASTVGVQSAPQEKKNGIADFYNSLVQSEQTQPSPFGTTPPRPISPDQYVPEDLYGARDIPSAYKRPQFIDQFNQPIPRETIVGSETPTPSNVAVTPSASTILSSNQPRNAPAVPIFSTNQGIANLLSFQKDQASKEEALALANSGLGGTRPRSGKGGGETKADQVVKLNDLTQEGRDQFLKLVNEGNRDGAVNYLLANGLDAGEVKTLVEVLPKSKPERAALVSDKKYFGEEPQAEVENIAVRLFQAKSKPITDPKEQVKETKEAYDAARLQFSNLSPRAGQPINDEIKANRAIGFDQVASELEKIASFTPKGEKETQNQYAQRLARLYYASEEQQQAVQSPQAAQSKQLPVQGDNKNPLQSRYTKPLQ